MKATNAVFRCADFFVSAVVPLGAVCYQAVKTDPFARSVAAAHGGVAGVCADVALAAGVGRVFWGSGWPLAQDAFHWPNA